MSELVTWWNSPVTASLAAGAMWLLAATCTAALAALVRLGAIQLAGLIAQKPRLLPGGAPRGDRFASLLLLGQFEVSVVLVGFALAAVRAGQMWGASGVASGLVALLGSAAVVVAGVVTARGRRIEVLATAMLVVLRPLVPLAVRLQDDSDETAFTHTDQADEDIDSHEVEAYLDAGQEAGILEREDAEMIASIVDFGDTVVREIMTPRTDIVAIPLDADFTTVERAFTESMFTRIVVFGDSVDRVEGVVHVKDVLRAAVEGAAPPLRTLLRIVPLVPETKPLRDLLREFLANHQQIAVVVDEYGGTSGIVTLEDVLEEIVGEIQDEHQREAPEVSPEGDGVFLVSGSAHVEILDELFDVEIGDEGFDSVAGLVLDCLGHLPRPGERGTWRGLEFEAVEVDRRRLRRVRVRRAEVAT